MSGHPFKFRCTVQLIKINGTDIRKNKNTLCCEALSKKRTNKTALKKNFVEPILLLFCNFLQICECKFLDC